MVTSAKKTLEMVIKVLINRISDVGWDKISLCLLAKATNKEVACMSRTADDEDDLQLVLSSHEPTIKGDIFFEQSMLLVAHAFQ